MITEDTKVFVRQSFAIEFLDRYVLPEDLKKSLFKLFVSSSEYWSKKELRFINDFYDYLFVPQVDSANCSVAFDQLLCNVNFQVYAVQNLDRNGLPF